jgi:hypothetical protein
MIFLTWIFPSLHGIDFTDVANKLSTAICSKYPSFVPTFEAPNDVDVLTMLANTIAAFSDAHEDHHPLVSANAVAAFSDAHKDHHPLVSAFCHVRKYLVLPAPAS